MSIDRITTNAAANTYQAQTVAASGAAQPVANVHHGRGGHKTQDPDSVTLSDGGRTLATARAAVDNASDVRPEKVAEIKKQIGDGTYQVSASVLARKMLGASQNQS